MVAIFSILFSYTVSFYLLLCTLFLLRFNRMSLFELADERLSFWYKRATFFSVWILLFGSSSLLFYYLDNRKIGTPFIGRFLVFILLSVLINVGFHRSLLKHTIRVFVKEVIKIKDSSYYSRGMGIKIVTVTDTMGNTKTVTVPFKRFIPSAQNTLYLIELPTEESKYLVVDIKDKMLYRFKNTGVHFPLIDMASDVVLLSSLFFFFVSPDFLLLYLGVTSVASILFVVKQ